jgi:septation ring formation regulator EzrA
MSWKDIIKDAEGDYQEILDAIANVEKLKEKLHISIDKSAKELSSSSGLSMEVARKLVGKIHDELFDEIDTDLNNLNRTLKQIVDRESLR